MSHDLLLLFPSQKVNRRLHLSKSKNTKFNESGQLCVFHLVSSVWSFYILITVSEILSSCCFSAITSCSQIQEEKYNYFLLSSYRKGIFCIPAAFGRTTLIHISGTVSSNKHIEQFHVLIHFTSFSRQSLNVRTFFADQCPDILFIY